MRAPVKFLSGLTVLGLCGVVSAASYSVDLDSFINTTPGDTRANGSAVFVPNSTFASPDGNGSIKLETTENPASPSPDPEKVAPFFYAGTLGTPLGTLGDLGRGSLDADWNFISRGVTTPAYVGNIAAFRMLVGAPTTSGFAELIWENEISYQGSVITPVPGTWMNLDLTNGKFYARWNGAASPSSQNTPETQGKTLAQWAVSGPVQTYNPNTGLGGDYFVSFSDSTPIYGIQVAVGSTAGDYVAYVDDVNMTFTAIPEPASLSLLGLGGLLMARRRRA